MLVAVGLGAQREHACARVLLGHELRCGPRGGHHVARRGVDAEVAEPPDVVGARADRVVGDERGADPRCAERRDGLRRARHDAATDVDRAVEVEQDVVVAGRAQAALVSGSASDAAVLRRRRDGAAGRRRGGRSVRSGVDGGDPAAAPTGRCGRLGAGAAGGGAFGAGSARRRGRGGGLLGRGPARARAVRLRPCAGSRAAPWSRTQRPRLGTASCSQLPAAPDGLRGGRGLGRRRLGGGASTTALGLRGRRAARPAPRPPGPRAGVSGGAAPGGLDGARRRPRRACRRARARRCRPHRPARARRRVRWPGGLRLGGAATATATARRREACRRRRRSRRRGRPRRRGRGRAGGCAAAGAAAGRPLAALLALRGRVPRRPRGSGTLAARAAASARGSTTSRCAALVEQPVRARVARVDDRDERAADVQRRRQGRRDRSFAPRRSTPPGRSCRRGCAPGRARSAGPARRGGTAPRGEVRARRQIQSTTWCSEAGTRPSPSARSSVRGALGPVEAPRRHALDHLHGLVEDAALGLCCARSPERDQPQLPALVLRRAGGEEAHARLLRHVQPAPWRASPGPSAARAARRARPSAPARPAAAARSRSSSSPAR